MFEFKGFTFQMRGRTLYRIKAIVRGRSYKERKVPQIDITPTIRGYRIVREKKSLRQIKQMIHEGVR